MLHLPFSFTVSKATDWIDVTKRLVNIDKKTVKEKLRALRKDIEAAEEERGNTHVANLWIFVQLFHFSLLALLLGYTTLTSLLLLDKMKLDALQTTLDVLEKGYLDPEVGHMNRYIMGPTELHAKLREQNATLGNKGLKLAVFEEDVYKPGLVFVVL